MRMYHPNLPYTKDNGGVEVTDAQFRLAWQEKGWRTLEDETPDESVDTDDDL